MFFFFFYTIYNIYLVIVIVHALLVHTHVQCIVYTIRIQWKLFYRTRLRVQTIHHTILVFVVWNMFMCTVCASIMRDITDTPWAIIGRIHHVPYIFFFFHLNCVHAFEMPNWGVNLLLVIGIIYYNAVWCNTHEHRIAYM